MLNFTVGPVMSAPEVLELGAQSAPYFRTPEFSKIMLENEERMLAFLRAPEGSRCVFLTTSGTGGMESVVMNVLRASDRVIAVNGGSFGERFANLSVLHGRETAEIRLPFGAQITAEDLAPFEGAGYTALLVNMDETSSGILYDMRLLSDFCRRNGLLLVVDAISAFLSDEIDMEALGAAVVITGSQKALAVAPGVAVIALAPEALRRVFENPETCLYLSLRQALTNGERGQTPFTPAVTTLLQIHRRLKLIEERGGIAAERARIRRIALLFREKIAPYGFAPVAQDPSFAVTALRAPGRNAREIVRVMKDEYDIWLCPNGGEIGEEVFRVGHIGEISEADIETLMKAFAALKARGIIG